MENGHPIQPQRSAHSLQKEFCRTSNFGALIAEIRNEHCLKQKQVAFEAGIDCSYVAALEKGRRSPPPQQTLQRLIKALHATATEQKRIEKSAALCRISRVISEHSLVLPNAQLILSLAQQIPELEEPALVAVRAVMEAFGAQPHRELEM